MKIKKGFILRNIAGSDVVMSVDPSTHFDGLIKLSGSGAFLWKQLQKDVSEEDLAKALTEEYIIDSEVAKEDVKEFVCKLKEADLLE